MKRFLLPVVLFLCLVTVDVVSQPSNDECSTARVLVQTSVCNPVTATTEDASESLPPLVCSGLVGYSDDDVWFTFIATASHVTIEVDGSPGFDAVVDFREYPCNGTPIACVDATGSGGTELISKTGLYIGNTYLIRVYSYGNGPSAEGTFTICAYGAPPYPPVNDDCPGSIWLLENTDCQMFTATTVSASQSMAAVLCNGNSGSADDDVWFIFKATTENPLVTVKGSPLFDPVIDLRTGACNGTPLFCSDSTGAGGTEAIQTFGLTTGAQYHIRVYGYGNGPNDKGEFDICVCESTVTGTGSLTENHGNLMISPNPFSDVLHIDYKLSEKSRVMIGITGILGNTISELTDQVLEPGTYRSEFRPDPEWVRRSGSVFFCLVSIGNERIIKKIIHLPY